MQAAEQETPDSRNRTHREFAGALVTRHGAMVWAGIVRRHQARAAIGNLTLIFYVSFRRVIRLPRG